MRWGDYPGLSIITKILRRGRSESERRCDLRNRWRGRKKRERQRGGKNERGKFEGVMLTALKMEEEM